MLSPADISELEVRLSPAGDGQRRFELEHTAIVPGGAVGPSTARAPSAWAGTRGCSGLSLHLRGGSVDDPYAWQLSDEGRDYATRSSEAWGAANRAAGADPEAAARAATNTTAFYAPDPADVPPGAEGAKVS